MTDIIVEMSEFANGTVLYGMMGCGKTRLGEDLAYHLGQPFIDTDVLIEYYFGVSRREVIDNPDRDFSKDQAEAILAYTPDLPTVIATGGSVAMYPDLVEHLNNFGVGIFINVDPRILKTRLSKDRIAGLNNPKKLSFDKLCEDRFSSYRNAASFILNISQDEKPRDSLKRLIELREEALRLQ